MPDISILLRLLLAISLGTAAWYAINSMLIKRMVAKTQGTKAKLKLGFALSLNMAIATFLGILFYALVY